MQKLSDKSFIELKAILHKEFGDDANKFFDEDINNLGVRFLKLTATAIKSKLFDAKSIK